MGDKLNCAQVIEKLGLQPLPNEGGYYNEIWRSGTTIHGPDSKRAASTSIYYLITPAQYSQWHKLNIDESWYFLGGTVPAKMDVILPNSEHRVIFFGGLDHIANSKFPCTMFFTVPSGSWFTVRCVTDSEQSGLPDFYSLFSCVCTPGFEFSDCCMGSAAKLAESFPQHAEIIKPLV